MKEVPPPPQPSQAVTYKDVAVAPWQLEKCVEMLQEKADKWGTALWSLVKTLKVGCPWVSWALLVTTLQEQKRSDPQKEEVPFSCCVPLMPSTDKTFSGFRSSTTRHKTWQTMDLELISNILIARPLPWTSQKLLSHFKAGSSAIYDQYGSSAPASPPGSNLLPACSSTLPRLTPLSSWSMTVAQAQTITNTVWRWKAWKRKRTKNATEDS